jgi:hypothetical protein
MMQGHEAQPLQAQQCACMAQGNPFAIASGGPGVKVWG